MRHPKLRMLAAAFLVLTAAACNKGPAEDSLGIAEQEIAAARPQLERYAPGELAALESAVQQARAELGEGHYTEALKQAQRLPARVRAALAAADGQKQKQAAVWKGLADSVPRLQETIATRIAWLNEAQRLPRAMDEAGFAAAPAELQSVRRAWAAAAAAFEAGDVATAVRSGQEVRKKSEILATRLGLVFSTAPPPAAATISPSPSTPSPSPSTPSPSPSTPSPSPSPSVQPRSPSSPSATPTPTPPPRSPSPNAPSAATTAPAP